MLLSFTSVVDSLQPDDDRIGIRFEGKVGYYWVASHRRELAALLRRVLASGERLEVTYDPASLEIEDAKAL